MNEKKQIILRKTDPETKEEDHWFNYESRGERFLKNFGQKNMKRQKTEENIRTTEMTRRGRGNKDGDDKRTRWTEGRR